MGISRISRYLIRISKYRYSRKYLENIFYICLMNETQRKLFTNSLHHFLPVSKPALFKTEIVLRISA